MGASWHALQMQKNCAKVQQKLQAKADAGKKAAEQKRQLEAEERQQQPCEMQQKTKRHRKMTVRGALHAGKPVDSNT